MLTEKYGIERVNRNCFISCIQITNSSQYLTLCVNRMTYLKFSSFIRGNTLLVSPETIMGKQPPNMLHFINTVHHPLFKFFINQDFYSYILLNSEYYWPWLTVISPETIMGIQPPNMLHFINTVHHSLFKIFINQDFYSYILLNSEYYWPWLTVINLAHDRGIDLGCKWHGFDLVGDTPVAAWCTEPSDGWFSCHSVMRTPLLLKHLMDVSISTSLLKLETSWCKTVKTYSVPCILKDISIWPVILIPAVHFYMF